MVNAEQNSLHAIQEQACLGHFQTPWHHLIKLHRNTHHLTYKSLNRSVAFSILSLHLHTRSPTLDKVWSAWLASAAHNYLQLKALATDPFKGSYLSPFIFS